MKLHHIIESQQFDTNTLDDLMIKAESFQDGHVEKCLEGKILCSLYYEPSTRTRFSHESAMLRLGGEVIGTEAAGMFSSAAKGESIADTIRTVQHYCDIIVLRSSDDKAAHVAASLSKVPVINAGCGKYGQHPTQSLLDMYTIKRELGRLDDIHAVIAGDLKYGRTVRSLAYMLGKFKNIRITFASPEHLKIEDDIKQYLERHNVRFSEIDELTPVIPEADVIYMTRIQKERMTDEEYLKAKGKFVMTMNELDMMKRSARLMHPLPHVEEIQIPIEVEDGDPRIAYFRQEKNGLYMRMALLKTILG